MRVEVGNLPVILHADAWVDVPDGTTVEGLDQAITDAVLAGRCALEKVKNTDIDLDSLAEWAWLVYDVSLDEDET